MTTKPLKQKSMTSKNFLCFRQRAIRLLIGKYKFLLPETYSFGQENIKQTKEISLKLLQRI